MVFPRRRALFLDAGPHSGDLFLPLRSIRREWQAGLAEMGQPRRQLLKLLSDFPVARDGPRAGEALNFPEHRAAAIVIFVSRGGVDEQSLLAIGTQPRVGGERNAEFGG